MSKVYHTTVFCFTVYAYYLPYPTRQFLTVKCPNLYHACVFVIFCGFPALLLTSAIPLSAATLFCFISARNLSSPLPNLTYPTVHHTVVYYSQFSVPPSEPCIFRTLLLTCAPYHCLLPVFCATVCSLWLPYFPTPYHCLRFRHSCLESFYCLHHLCLVSVLTSY